MKLTRFPIVIFYGDYIPKAPTNHPHNDYWRAASEMADLFAQQLTVTAAMQK